MTESEEATALRGPLRDESIVRSPSAGPRSGGQVRRAALIVVALAFAAARSAAQLPAPTPSEEAASDPYGRETPHGCFFGFLKAAGQGAYENAAEYLQVPPSLRAQRERIAAQLQEVLDQRFVSPGLERISRSPRGTTEDGLPPNVEKVGEILGPDGLFDVLLVRHEPPGAGPVWLISWETIREVRRVYGELGATAIAGRLPKFLVQTRIGSLRLWQIIAFLLLLPALYGVSWLLVGAVFSVIRLLRRTKRAGAAAEWTASARSPVTLLVALLLHRIAVFWLGISVMYRVYYNRFLYVLMLLGLLWLLLRIVDVVDRRLLRRMLPAGQIGSGPSVSLVRRGLRAAALIFVLLLALPVFGVNVTATLAGLGVGGLVLAFAAQKSLENVFGGFAILADRPLSVGDTCRIDGQLGDVEDITLWATRMRTYDRTVVSIPNGAVMAGRIENLTRRDKFWFHPTVGLAYETTASQMHAVLAGVRALLEAEPLVEKESARVRFARLGASSLDIDVYAYVRVATFREFLAVQEGLLLRILETVERAGTSVAFPSQTVYLRSDEPDPGKSGGPRA